MFPARYLRLLPDFFFFYLFFALVPRW